MLLQDSIMTDEKLIKNHWKKVSTASNGSDDIWIKDKYALVHGYYASMFYIEELVDGKFLDVNDPNRKAIAYKLGDINEAIYYVDRSINSRIREIRSNKLDEIGI